MPDRMDLSDKGWVIFGPRGSGKSWLVDSILDTTKDHLVYDPMSDHAGYRHYAPEDRSSIEELTDVVEAVVIPTKPALFIVDEANKYIQPKPAKLPAGIDDLMDFGRHWGISVGFVARRPVQFHTDLIELADVVFFFGLHGKNDYQYMEDLHLGLGDEVRKLAAYHFVSLRGGREIQIHNPVDLPSHAVHT